MMGWGYLDCQADTPAGGAELVGGQAGEGALVSAVKRSIGSTTVCTITEKAPTRAFS